MKNCIDSHGAGQYVCSIRFDSGQDFRNQFPTGNGRPSGEFEGNDSHTTCETLPFLFFKEPRVRPTVIHKIGFTHFRQPRSSHRARGRPELSDSFYRPGTMAPGSSTTTALEQKT